MLIDTHCHVHFNAYKEEDSDEVIRRAFSNSVRMITVGTEAGTSKGAVVLAEKYKAGIWAAVGMHPNHLYDLHHDESELPAPKPRLEEFDAGFYKKLALSSKKVVAIGECGLDYYRIPERLDAEEIMAKQQSVFREHIHLAAELNLPLIVHVRNGSSASAHEDTIRILHDEIHQGNLPKRGVIHCFSGTWEDAKRYFDFDFLISFTGTIAFPPKKNEPDILREVVIKSPINMIMVETDSPYLAPPPYRGKRNEPSYVRLIAEHLAKIKNLDFEEITRQTTKNATVLFNLK